MSSSFAYRSFAHRWLVLLAAFLAATLLLSGNLRAQQQSCSGSSKESWGSYRWQVDQGTSTVTFTAQGLFNTPPGTVQVPISLSRTTVVRHIHGSVSLWVPESGVNGSIIAIVRDQNGNALAAVKMQQFGTATATIPIDATLSSPLTISSLVLAYCVDLPGTQVVHISLVMS